MQTDEQEKTTNRLSLSATIASGKLNRLSLLKRALATKQRSFPTFQTDMGDNLLTKRFGDETINFFAGSKLNRFSFKRQDNDFLSKCVTDPQTRFLTFHNLDPLATKEGKLVLLKLEDVKQIIGNPYELTDDEKIKQWSADDDATIVVFLGLDESKATAQGGEAFFAVDMTPNPKSKGTEKQDFLAKVKDDGLEFKNVRVGVKLEQDEGAVVAMGRSLIDWNARHQYCNGCGGKTIGVWAGTKRQCPDRDRITGDRQSCISRKGLHNYQYPRTDAVIIMGIISEDGSKLLLGRQKAWPKGMYSCLAGFIEPGESLEEAVRREVWEESGVQVGRVQYHSSQPWPFPSNLMIGTIGQALPGSKIDLGNDPELEDARWFSREELSSAGVMGVEGQGDKDKTYSTPPEMAIAKKLINCWVNDDWKLQQVK